MTAPHAGNLSPEGRAYLVLGLVVVLVCVMFAGMRFQEPSAATGSDRPAVAAQAVAPPADSAD